jgi:AbiV family abortive infection protein
MKRRSRRGKPLYSSTILRLEQQTFYNAFYLLNDACTLYEAQSYPTACALAILAFEEIGKLHCVDHVGFEACLSNRPERVLRLDHLFSRELFFHHRRKQEWAAMEIDESDIPKRLLDGRLERLKQSAFYVGFSKGRIITPARITQHRAYTQIRDSLRVFVRTRDLPFFPVFDQSTRATQRHAARFTNYLTARINDLKRPHRRRRSRR